MIRCGWLTLFCLAAGCGQAAREHSGAVGSWAIAGAASLGGQSAGAETSAAGVSAAGASAEVSGAGVGSSAGGASAIAATGGNGGAPNPGKGATGNGGAPNAGKDATGNGGSPNAGNGGTLESFATGGSVSTAGGGGAADLSNGVISMCSSSTSAETRIALQVETDLDEELSDVTVTTRLNDEFASRGLSVTVTLVDVKPPGAASIDAWRVNSVSAGALIGLTVGVYPPLPHVQVTVELVSASHGILATGSVLVIPFDWSSCGKIG